MSDNIQFPIIKGTDQDYIQILRSIAETDSAKALGLKQLKLTPVYSSEPWELNPEEALADEKLKPILEADGKVFKQLILGPPEGIAYVQVSRTDNFGQGTSEPNDKLHFVLNRKGKNAPSEDVKQNFAQLIADGQRAAKTLSVSSLGPLLGEETTRLFDAQQQAIARLETQHARLVHDLAEERKTLQEDHQKRSDKLDADHQSRLVELEKSYHERHEELDKRATQLDKEKQELDDRSSTHVRRELRTNLKEILETRQTNFALSEDTQKRRRWVLGAYIGVLLAFAALAINFIVVEHQNASQTPEYALWLRQAAPILGFFITAGFFLRWLNSWAQQHAEEEFKLKQLDLDIDRASWLVEMAFEWSEEKGPEIPSVLLETLSKNLFGPDKRRKADSLTASDAIANALMGTDGTFKIQLPGGEVILDKKALQKARKDRDSQNAEHDNS